MSKGNRNRQKRKKKASKSSAGQIKNGLSINDVNSSIDTGGMFKEYSSSNSSDFDPGVHDINQTDDVAIENFKDYVPYESSTGSDSGSQELKQKKSSNPFFKSRSLNRGLRKLASKADSIISLESKYASMTDSVLSSQTSVLRERLKRGESLEDIMGDAYAVAREAAWRTLGLKAFKVQIMGAIVLHYGDIAEMKTGEGKTLTSIMPAYLNALEGNGVHIVTVNDYLAQRDATDNGKVFNFLGISVGLNKPQLPPDAKRAAYDCDITYTTNSELGFDYLRDNMVYSKKDKVLRGLHYAIIDEVDSILIDEARTPLIISSAKENSSSLYIKADRFVKSLKPDQDYTVDMEARNVALTPKGIGKAEKSFGISNLYAPENMSLIHSLNQALKANYIMKANVDYMVATSDGSRSRDNASIMIIDEFTGRILEGREYSDGLHQAIEAKEGVPIRNESKVAASVTYQNFFRLYSRISGMTGTAKTEEDEFKEIYNMRVIEIPPNVPFIRDDLIDKVYKTKSAKYEAICDEVERRHSYGQPVLLGTISVEVSEILSRMLKKRGIKHNVLNAKNHAFEAEIIANAGVIGAVTIATNMAGRGTDIKLGPGVADLGGLAVIGSERHESRRIDNQLQGRSGRQGDPGSSQFYLSLEDDLMTKFSNDSVQKFGNRFMGDAPMQTKSIVKAIRNTQKRVENNNFESRKNVIRYDNVVAQQREIMYRERDEIISTDDLEPIIRNMFKSACLSELQSVESRNSKDVDTVVDESVHSISRKYAFKTEIVVDKANSHIPDIFAEEGADVFSQDLAQCLLDCYKQRLNPNLTHEQKTEYERYVILNVLDRIWIDHIDNMEKTRNSIILRAYAQRDPLNEYTEIGYDMFNEATLAIAKEISSSIVRMGVAPGSSIERRIPSVTVRISILS